MTKDQFKTEALAKGWQADKHGHVKHTTAAGKIFRIKLQAISWRLEKQFSSAGYGDKTVNSWARLRGSYYSATGPGGAVVPELPQ